MTPPVKISKDSSKILQRLNEQWTVGCFDPKSYLRLAGETEMHLRTIFGMDHEIYQTFKKLHEDLMAVDYTFRAWDIGGEEENWRRLMGEILLFFRQTILPLLDHEDQ